MGAIYRREVGAFFTSSIAYVFLAVFYLAAGYFFFGSSLAMATTDMSNLFSSLFFVITILIPVLTMRLFSEEKKQKTEQGLLTAPVSIGGIVMGKYLAALTLYTIGLAIIFVYALILSFFGAVAWGIVISNILALFLLGAAFIAVTLFISSLTENQVVAAVLGMIVLLALIMLIGTVVNSSIVLVDYIETRRSRGQEKDEAIMEACPLRVRPILMTTMTTVLALIPMAMGSGEGNEMLQPMGVVMIFGMVISTIVTLLFTPVYYSVLDSLTEMLGRPFKIRHAKRAAKLQAQIAALEAEAEDSENA